MIQKITFILLLISIVLSNNAQQALIEKNILKQLNNSNVQVVNLPSLDYHGLEQKAKINRSKQVPYQIGELYSYNIVLNNLSAKKIKDYWVTSLELKSPNAKGLALTFTQTILKNKAKIIAYNNLDTVIAHKAGNHIYSIPPIKGKFVNIAVLEQSSNPESKVVLTVVSQIFKDFKNSYGFAASGSCNINTICPEGDPYRDQIDAVVLTLKNNAYLCSGALVNNTCRDARPYVLTANHCVADQTTDAYNVQTIDVVFNWESPLCDSTTSGPVNQFVSGVTLKARSEHSDFALLELSSLPPDSFGLHYLGFDATGVTPSRTFGIHHPSGDVKKLSFDNNSPSSTLVNWHVEEWELGTTEPGSSGSPLLNQSNRIVGQLCCGASACGNPVNDFYGRMDLSWDYHADPSKQLKYWLDACSTGELSIEGFDPDSTYIPPIDTSGNDTIVNPIDTNNIDTTIISPEIPVDSSNTSDNGQCFSGEALSVSVVNETSLGQQNGSIAVSSLNTPIGVTFSYQWSTGAVYNEINNLSVGNYTVTVIYDNGCELIQVIYVGLDSLPVYPNDTISCNGFSVGLSAVNTSGLNQTDGQVVTSVIGGEAPYQYQWSNGSLDQNLINIQTGFYSLLVIDSNGCEYVDSIMVSYDSLVCEVFMSLTSTNEIIAGANDGTVNVIVQNGIEPYVYQWSNGSNQSMLQGLSPGIYALTFTDSIGCELRDSVRIFAAGDTSCNLQITSYILAPSSNNGNDGGVEVVVNFGAPPYNFIWNTGDQSNIIENVSVGTYLVTVSDLAFCSEVVLVNVGLESDTIMNFMPVGLNLRDAFPGFTLYPNPLIQGQKLTIDELNGTYRQLTVYDGLGRSLLKQALIGKHKVELPIQYLVSGWYIISLESYQGKRQYRKVLVE